MKNVFRILKRDILRLIKAPAALVVVLALCVFPSLYTWYNVAGFWNPYDNTGNLRVCFVNEDLGGQSELTGTVNVGSLIGDALHENKQLDWAFLDADDAMEELKSGRAFAIYQIPKDFTQKLLTLTTGNFVQPNIEYYVNEKLGPVSPKITDAGSTTLDEMLNSTFVSVVSETILKTFDETLENADKTVSATGSQAADELTKAINTIASTRTTLDQLGTFVNNTQDQVYNAHRALEQARTDVEAASVALADVSKSADALGKELATLSTDAQDTATALYAVLDGLAEEPGPIGEAAKQARTSMQTYLGVIMSTMQATNEALALLAQTSAALSTSVGNMRLLIEQSNSTLDQLSETLTAAGAASSQTSSLLATLMSDLSRLRADVMLMARSNAYSALAEQLGLNSEDIASFLGAPTRIVTEQLYTLPSYGAGMAPLFMNLTFWIGAFMLMIIIRQEVDDEKLRKLTVPQRYLGRFLLLAVIAVAQAVVCCAGILLMGIEPANTIALFVASAIASLSYLSLIFALSVTLQHIGKGICIVLVFAQIPAATGIYPIEMTSSFFQAIYPFLPFTYGIDAMREAICGFYGHQYAFALLVLGGFFVLGMVCGLAIRPLLANVNRMFAKQVYHSEIFNGEKVEVPAREFRLGQIIKALSGKEEYRRDLTWRYLRFSYWYPRVIRGSVVLIVAVSVGMSLALALSSGAKVVLLTVWVLLLIALFIVLVVTENMRQNFERQLELDKMSAQSLFKLFSDRKGLSRTLGAEKAETPGAQATSATPGAQGSPGMPGVSTAPGEPRASATPGTSEAPGMPGTAEAASRAAQDGTPSSRRWPHA